MNRSESEIEEFRRDCEANARQEEYHENKLYNDFDFAWETLVSESDKLTEVYNLLEDIVKDMAKYEHDISIKDVIDELKEI